MALTKVSTDGVKDDAVTTDKLANAINTERTANTAKVQTTINNNGDNKVITGSGTANTLNGESNLAFNGTHLNIGASSVTEAEITGRIHRGDNNGNQLQFTSANTGTGNSDGLRVGWNGAQGQMFLYENADMRFATNATERMRIDSSGKVGIGTTSPSHQLHVESSASGVIAAKQTTNNGGYNIFEGKDSSGNVKFYATHNGRVGAADGIIFGSDTAAANILDGYEEGTWTPTTPIGSMNSVHGAHYTKIGRMVNVQAYVTMPTSSSSTAIQITGFPFTALGSSHYAIGAAYCQWQGNNHFFVQMSPGSTTANPHYGIGHGISYATASANYLLFSLTYYTS